MIKRFFILLLAIVASVGMSWATDPIVIATNTEQSSYTQGSITVSVNYVGDSDGFRLNDDNSASISNSGSSTISKIELVPGWFLNKHSYVRANGAEPNSSSEELITFLNVNSNEVTLSCSVSICIKEVRVYFGEPAPAKLPGAFTINANGDKIVFSRGNLQATTTDLGANWTWDFAPNQWSLIGNAVANNAIKGNKKVSANGTVDLFGWSTAATYYGINESWKNDDYAGDFVDWGALMGTEWRTLSRAEFYYIVYSRAQAAYKRGQATVNGVPGYVLLPDAWTLPDGLSFTNSIENYTTNQYDGAYWTAMESAGAVFLPAAGVREGTDIYQVNLYGWYWASTPNETDGGKAYYLWFDKSSQGVTEYNRWKSKSVRLVTEAPIPPYEAAIKLINEIPNPVVLIAACKAKIDAARTAYDALSAEDKALVTNYSTLTNAEEAWQALIPDPVVLPTVKYAVCNVPDGWAVTANGDAVLPINGRYHIADGQTVVLTPPASTEVGSMTSAEEAGLLGAGTAEDPYLIYTVAHWNAVAAKVNDGTQAAPNCRQMANLNGVTTVMGNSESKPFKGIYDGNGFVFSNVNLSITSGSNPLGLFGCVNDASAVVKNVVVAGGTVSSTSQNVGAIVGQLNGGTVQYCANYATVSSSYNGKVRMGGIVGWMRSAGGDNNRVNYCINYGNVSGIGYVGGITGSYGAGNVNYCHNYGSISSSGTDEATSGSAGGIIGWDAADDATKITYNHNGGNITLVKEHSYKPSRYIIANTNSNATSVNVIVPNSNSYLSSLTLTIGSTSYTGADLATHEPNAQALAINPEGITISGITYAYGVAAPIAPAPGTNPGTDPAKQSNKTWQFTMPSHNIGLTVIIYPAEVIAKINNIPTPVTLKLATRDSIEGARAAYDALTAEQKALVPVADLQKLTDAEAALAALNPGGGAPLPEGALTGAFSINADGDKIAFSKGNLQATTANLGETWTWAFAAHQYDYVGNAVANTAITGNKTVSTNGTIDLFGWSTAATYYGINNTNVSGKHPGDFIDWGETIAEGWRTLTRDEWNYLFETRTDAASKYGHATVAGIHGIIVLPDSYKGTAINADHSDWSNNIISAEDWAAYEANGVAFLPAAGSRLATSVNYVGEYAFYWTSTTYGEKWAYRVRFVPNLSPDYGDRVPGQSVRLVTAHTGSPTPLDSAQAVKDLIEAIPAEITLDAACVNAVQAARDAYNALAEATKGALDDATVQKLNQAITDYTALIQAGADAVTAKIAAIPQPVTLKLATRDSIESARAAYNALTADQQALVTNYAVLEAAEAALAALNPGGGAPADALNGKFTINAGGDQIAFAKGNLQATTTDLGAHWTWGFAANQWNYLGIAVANSKINGNGTVSENGTVDLFGWSTNATYYGINNSYKAVDYTGDFVDWGPNMGAGWRTLTKDEWAYLLQHSSNGKATVNDKNGYIFLPDNWSGPAFTPNPDNFTTNVYSGDDWTAMENAGAVFLPSGPARNGVYALIANDARYYSSTSLNNDSSYVFTIYYNQSQSACTGTNRAYGCMVRLVSEGGGATPLDSAQAVKDLIEAIPTPVTLEDACVKAIEDARAAYDALSEATKGALDAADVKKLTDVEAALKALNQAEADKVIAKINNIPTPVELKLATRDSIESARAAYDALTAYQKPMVTNYQKLLDAEAALAELNKGGSASVDIVWDGNTGIEDVSPSTTSPAYEGMTVTVGKGSSFSTYQSRLYFTFYSQPNGGFIFANENGTNITKVVIESTTALTSTMTEVDRMGSGWVISNENKTATWTGNTDSVSIWKGQSFTNYWVVDKITFTVNGSSTPLDSAQAVKDLIDAIPTPVEYPTSGPAIAAALVAYNQLSDAAKGALDAADVQKMTDAAIQYAALDAIVAIDAIPAEIVYDPAVKAAIETAREKYDALIDASKALVDAEVVAKLTNAEQVWADLVALIEHNVTYIGKDGELKNEKVALLHIPNPAPEFNGYEFVRWDVKAGNFLEEGLRIKAVYTPIITTDPVAYDTLVYNGTAQTLITAGVASDGHIEYRLNEGDWSAELPKADMAAAYVVDYKLVREGHEDYMAGSVTAVIAKAPVTYVAPQAYDTLAYNYNTQVLVTAGQTNDGTIEYSLDPNMLDSWSADLPQAMNAGTYAVYFRVQGDLNHFDSIAPAPVAVTIAKRDIEVTAPVAYDTLVYNALAQTLAAAGSADFSTMEYTLTPDNGEGWSADMPQAMNAGTYAIYYRVQGDNNHNDYPAHSIAATIAQAPLTITAENKEVIYGDAAPEFTATYSGWMGQDDATVISNLQITSTYAAGSSVGTYDIVPSGATALNYAMSYVNGTLTVNKAKVSVINAEAQKAKFADGHAVAVVLNQGTLDGVKLNDAVTHVTTAAFSSAEVAENLTITLFYELQGDEALLANYLLEPTSKIFSEEGVIIEPFLPDNEGKPEDEEAKIQEGIEVYAYGYCTGTGYSLNYHLNSGNPDQYKIEFEDSRFDDVAYEETKIAGSDGHIDIEIPDGLPTGDYKMSITFRDSRFPWLESKAFDVTFHVNLPETYVKPLFNNTIILVDTCECMTDIQWYHRADATKTWQPVAGATGHYLHVDGQLTGEYFVAAKMNGVPTYTCGQEDMQTLYGADNNRQAKVRAYPNPVVNTTTVSIENSDSYEHNLRIVNLMGIEVMNTTFEGDDTVVNMDGYVTGNYTISVDGIAVKVLKQ